MPAEEASVPALALCACHSTLSLSFHSVPVIPSLSSEVSSAQGLGTGWVSSAWALLMCDSHSHRLIQ